MPFLPLRIRSGFSYLMSALPAQKIGHLAKKHGYGAVGLADLDSVSGYAQFCHGAEKEGITPLYGMETELESLSIALYVETEEGYRNLLSLAYELEKGPLGRESLRARKAGLSLIAIPDPHREGIIENSLLSFLVNEFKHLYIGLPFLRNQKGFADKIRLFGQEHLLPVLAFPLVCYEKREDRIALEILNAIKEKGNLKTKSISGDECFLPLEELSSFYTEEELENTNLIKDNSAFTLIKKRGTLLEYEDESGKKPETLLRELCEKGLKDKLDDPLYRKRLDYELEVIGKMGYSSYFLIVGDYVAESKRRGILVGPGRGSGAGSLVSYALGIVRPDPIEHGLLFERFLNPERLSMPDIDVDFEDTRRGEVVAYLRKKYGKDRVSHILTTQTIGAREAVRDVARVYSYPERDVSLLLSTIVDDRLSLRDNYRKNPQFRKLVDSDPYYLEFVALSSKIEGIPRQAGLHAAGIILNNEKLEGLCPIKDDSEVGLVAQLEKDYLEEQGFLKMDILGLRNLSIVQAIIALIEKRTGQKLDYETLPYADEKALSLIRSGKTMGVFQLESPGMKRAIREVEPETFNDLSAILALFRPGPMGQIPHYAKRKKGLEKVTYPLKELEDILSSTFGIIVYQEQIMQIVQKMANCSYGKADSFRRAISKKDAQKLKELEGDFISSSVRNGKTEREAKAVYELIYKFADYGFNKSHAVSYAYLSSQMAYLKAHYPKESYAIILNSLSPADRKFRDTLSEMREFDLELISPSVNESDAIYKNEEKGLRVPLSIIKGLPSAFTERLLEEREFNGPFTDIFDLAKRLYDKGLTLQNLMRLIDAGALDCLDKPRSVLRAIVPMSLKYAEMASGIDEATSLFSLGVEKPSYPEASVDILYDLEKEKEALGIMISGSPLSQYRLEAEGKGGKSLSETEGQKRFVTYGLVKSVRSFINRSGKQMAFLDLYDEYEERSFTVFSECYENAYRYLKVDKPLLVKARADEFKGTTSYTAEEIKPLGE